MNIDSVIRNITNGSNGYHGIHNFAFGVKNKIHSGMRFEALDTLLNTSNYNDAKKVLKEIKIPTITANDSYETLVSALILIILSDLTPYDYKLIDLITRKGLQHEEILQVIIINDRANLKDFCSKNDINGLEYSNVFNLKIMSDMYRASNNFNVSGY